MTSWMGRIGRADRRDTETIQFVFMHSPDGHPVCGVVPLIVGENEATAKAVCDELAAFSGGALVRQDTQLPYTALQAALDERFPFNANYWDKGVFIDWDPEDSECRARDRGCGCETLGPDAEFASKLSTFVILMEVNGAVGRADPASTSFAARKGRPWCTSIAGWPDGDASRRVAMKKWCDAFATTLSPYQVTSYLNNAMPESEAEMLGVFPQDTMKRLRALKRSTIPTTSSRWAHGSMRPTNSACSWGERVECALPCYASGCVFRSAFDEGRPDVGPRPRGSLERPRPT